MHGIEWVVEAHGADPVRLGDVDALAALFTAIVRDMALHQVAPAAWHVFPPPGGVTGVVMLSESHLTVHTFPEHGSLCLNVFCCRPRASCDWQALLAMHVGADHVVARQLERVYGSTPVSMTHR
jgi:S-adenosylmethionine decarboxylase